jgi:hypothetical protein
MKKTVFRLVLLIVLPALLLISSCKKNSTPMASIQVKDAITRSVVNGAVVGIHRCTIFEAFCGFIAYRSNTTGNDGSCSFNQEDYDQTQSITVSKNGYWLVFEPKTSVINIYPDGWLKLRIIKGASYPAGSKLRIVANYTPGSKTSILQVNTAADSSILLRCYGGASNRIDWFVETTTPFAQINNGSFLQNITRQDTVNAVLNY